MIEHFLTLPSRQIGDVNEGVIERGVDVSHSKDVLVLSNLGSKGDLDLLLVLSLSLTGCHPDECLKPLKIEHKSRQICLEAKQNRKR